jgi:hypothetical protein
LKGVDHKPLRFARYIIATSVLMSRNIFARTADVLATRTSLTCSEGSNVSFLSTAPERRVLALYPGRAIITNCSGFGFQSKPADAAEERGMP